MNTGLEIIINRMKTNPEEFGYNSKWTIAIERYKPYFSEEEMKRFADARSQMYMDEFSEVILKTLTGEELDLSTTIAYQNQPHYAQEMEMKKMYALQQRAAAKVGIVYGGSGGGGGGMQGWVDPAALYNTYPNQASNGLQQSSSTATGTGLMNSLARGLGFGKT